MPNILIDYVLLFLIFNISAKFICYPICIYIYHLAASLERKSDGKKELEL